MHDNNTVVCVRNIYKISVAFLYAAYCYFVSFQYFGPAYASDEIGYLSKAASLSGYAVDWQTSWHAGYSILLIPAYLVAQDPYDIWLIIIFINALMMGIALWGTQELLLKLFAEDDYKTILLASLFGALYPGFIVMSGYAFATPAFLMFYVLSLLLLESALNKGHMFKWMFFALFSGYLYWIHPLGAIPCMAAILISIKRVGKHGLYITAIISLVLISVIIVYNYVFLGFLDGIMGKWDSEQYLHYSDTLNGLIGKLNNLDYWINAFSFFLGQVGALLIGSCGFVFYIFIRDKKYENIISENVDNVFLYIRFNVIGLLLVGAFQLAAGDRDIRSDFYVYGRYVEMILMPVLGIGFLCFRDSSKKLIIPLFLFFVGILLDIVAESANSFNEINVIAFWPRIYVFGDSFFVWFLLGAFVIYLLSNINRTVIVLFSFVLFIIPLIYHLSFHGFILNNYANPSGLVDYVRANYKSGSTVYFDSIKNRRGGMGDHHEMPNIYIYYLYDYKLENIDFDQWERLGVGPFISNYNYYSIKDLSTIVVGRNIKNSMILYDNKKRVKRYYDLVNDDFVYAKSETEAKKIVSLLYVSDLDALKSYKKNGIIRNDKIYTSGSDGLFMTSPEVRLIDGKYVINIDACTYKTKYSYIDIVSDGDGDIIKRLSLDKYSDKGNVNIHIPFVLDSAATDIRMKIFVHEHDSLSISKYVFKTMD